MERTIEWQEEMEFRQRTDHEEVVNRMTEILGTELGTAEDVRRLHEERLKDREEDRTNTEEFKKQMQSLVDLLQEVCPPRCG